MMSGDHQHFRGNRFWVKTSRNTAHHSYSCDSCVNPFVVWQVCCAKVYSYKPLDNYQAVQCNQNYLSHQYCDYLCINHILLCVENWWILVAVTFEYTHDMMLISDILNRSQQIANLHQWQSACRIFFCCASASPRTLLIWSAKKSSGFR